MVGRDAGEARPGDGRLAIGTIVSHAGDYQCIADGCAKPAPAHIWTGTEFVSACERHVADVAELVAGATAPPASDS